jgi:glycerol kinase
MENDAHIHLERLRVDGGACTNDFLMQFQSDILGIQVIRPACVETTAMGAAFLTGLAVGFWTSLDQLRTLFSGETIFTPGMEEEKRSTLLRGWHRAVELARGWAQG